jgi:hypothetical protein
MAISQDPKEVMAAADIDRNGDAWWPVDNGTGVSNSAIYLHTVLVAVN